MKAMPEEQGQEPREAAQKEEPRGAAQRQVTTWYLPLHTGQMIPLELQLLFAKYRQRRNHDGWCRYHLMQKQLLVMLFVG